jgi:membrane-bound lytic murein transglycosylase D
VPAFIGATYAMTYYADHGISPALAKKPILTDTIHVNQRIYFGPIASSKMGI